MSIAEHIAESVQQAKMLTRSHNAPTGWEPGVRFDPATGQPAEVVTGLVPGARASEGDWAELVGHLLPMVPAGFVVRLVEARYDPVAWTRDVPRGEDGAPAPATTRPAWRYRFRIVPAENATGAPLDVQALVDLVRARRPHHTRRPEPVSAARVVILSDLQTGKADAGGGSTELVERVEDKLDKLTALMRAEPAEHLVIADPGDLIENAWNVTAQGHTNDLSVPDQLRLARVILTEIVARLSPLASSTRVLTVPSNHGQWRSSMGPGGQAGRPGDDFGIDVHRAVAEAHHLAGRGDVSWIIPDPWVESLATEVAPGFVLGLVHGHQWRAGRAAEWWKGQSLGDGPTAAAHVLVHGHYHNSGLSQAGHLDGRPRWIVAADAMDGGSSWWTNLTGEKSEPSVTTFVVDDARWDRYRRVT